MNTEKDINSNKNSIEYIRKEMVKFGNRNSISVYLSMYEDGSLAINEFWTDDILQSFEDLAELGEYLKNGKHES